MTMAGIPYSITASGKYEPFGLQVSRGQIMGHRSVVVFGFNPDVDQTEETVWPSNGVVTHPASATVMKVSSDSASDTAAGTGARTVVISGLDANYNEISETVTLNGQTAVNTVNLYLRINDMYVATTGSGLVSAGNIYIGNGVVTAGVPATLYDLMYIGYNKRTTGHYTVPAGYTAYMVSGALTSGQNSGSNQVTGRLVTTNSNSVSLTQAVVALNNGQAFYDFQLPLAIPEKTDIEARAIGASNNNAISSMFQICLIANTV
jgi:hypothetical protein